jgi:signal peptidase
VRDALRFTWTAIQGAFLALLVAVIALLALPHFTSFDALVVSGRSMEPAIHLGSVVVVDRSDRVPQVGAVVTFHDPTEGIVTHRVVAVGPSSFETKGDANNSVDVTTRSFSDVIGTVRFSVPYLGYLLYLLELPLVFLALLVVVGGALIFGELRTIAAEVRKIRRARVDKEPIDG